MRNNASEMTQYMKNAVAEQGIIWADYEKKIAYQ
jgi:hypothetical protein